jgi:hypothetical protein
VPSTNLALTTNVSEKLTMMHPTNQSMYSDNYNHRLKNAQPKTNSLAYSGNARKLCVLIEINKIQGGIDKIKIYGSYQ